MRVLFAIGALAAIAACSQPAPEKTDAPDSGPDVAACNALQPDLSLLTPVQDEAAAALPAADILRGGPIEPGVYDLVSAVRIGAATGWSAPRAVALEVSEDEDGVTLNWAGAGEGEAIDTWTASLVEIPATQVSYVCGRVGTVGASYVAEGDTLTLQIQDGAGGALHMAFVRRA